MQNKYLPTYDVIVIGGGPAGLMAAASAASMGAKTLLLEKTYRVGAKLLLSGGGRCNVTNIAQQREFIKTFGENGSFFYQAFNAFSNTDLIELLEENGVATRIDPDGKVFPADDKAQSVLCVLRKLVEERRVRILHNSDVDEIIFSDNESKKISGVKLTSGAIFPAKTIIIATGGLSYPQTGSSGAGYKLAKQCGHTITPLLPGLVPLESNASFIKEVQGLTLRSVKISLLVDGENIFSQLGDLLFTHFGVSGPTVLVLSQLAVKALSESKIVKLSINLKPQYANEFHLQLQSELTSAGQRSLRQYLEIVLPRTLSPVISAMCVELNNKLCATLNKTDLKKVATLFTDFTIPITKTRPIEEATITCGGVSLNEINPQTMQSKINNDLFFCGEVIDLAGITGGYNLQEAFSTGFLAGASAAKFAKL